MEMFPFPFQFPFSENVSCSLLNDLIFDYLFSLEGGANLSRRVQIFLGDTNFFGGCAQKIRRC